MTPNNATLDPDVVHQWRRRRFRHGLDRRVRSCEQALEFVNDVGFCLLFPAKGLLIPTLWEAVCGELRPLPAHHDDVELGQTWRWKDELPSRGTLFYGKLLRKKPTLISLELLPYFYALSENYGDLLDYLSEYRDGRLSEEAKRVYEAVLEHGAQPTSYLRRQAGLAGKSNAARFDRAVLELQLGLKIVKTGVSDAKAWKYCYIYDLLMRRWPELPAQAAHISSRSAMSKVLLTYLSNVGAARIEDMAQLFGWESAHTRRLCEALCTRGQVLRDVEIEGWSGFHVALPALRQATD